MTMDDTTREPQDTPDPAGQQDINDTTTIPTPSAPAAPPQKRKALTRPWTWFGIAAAVLLLGGGIFVAGVVAGKTLGDQHESHHQHQVGKSQSDKPDKSGKAQSDKSDKSDDDDDDNEDQTEATQNEAPNKAQLDKSTPAATSPAMTTPTPSATVSTPPAKTPPAATTR